MDFPRARQTICVVARLRVTRATRHNFTATSVAEQAMPRHVVVVQGSPDPQAVDFCQSLADRHAPGIPGSGFPMDRIDVAKLEFPTGTPLPATQYYSQAMQRTEHRVIFCLQTLGL